MTSEPLEETRPNPIEPTRRDFLYVATAAAGAVGTLAALIPMIAQMNPDAATLAAGGPVDFDLSKVQPGQQVMINLARQPYPRDPPHAAGAKDASGPQTRVPGSPTRNPANLSRPPMPRTGIVR